MQPDIINKTVRRRRTSALRIRVTPDERRAIDAAAERVRLGPCSYARVVVLEAVGQVPTKPPRRQRKSTEHERSLALVLGQIGKLGNNLNQLARWANCGGRVDKQSIDAARDELRLLRKSIVPPDEIDSPSS